MTSKIKNIIIFSGIAFAFILIYIFFIKPSSDQANLAPLQNTTTLPNIDGTVPGVGTTNTNPLIAKDFLVLLSSVKNIKLDDTIFSDQAFNSLHDSSITLIPDGTEGRPNPFAQFGNESLPLNTTNLVLPPTNTTSPATPSTSIPAKP